MPAECCTDASVCSTGRRMGPDCVYSIFHQTVKAGFSLMDCCLILFDFTYLGAWGGGESVCTYECVRCSARSHDTRTLYGYLSLAQVKTLLEERKSCEALKFCDGVSVECAATVFMYDLHQCSLSCPRTLSSPG